MTIDTGRLQLVPESLQEVLGKDTKQVVVYGFRFTRYAEIIRALQVENYQIKKVFDHTFGSVGFDKITEEGEEIEPFHPSTVSGEKEPTDKATSRQCKSAISALILENYKRKKLGLPIIPLLFCIQYSDSSRGTHKSTTAEQVTSKIKDLNQLITHSELRRAYKHCKELALSDDPLLRELAQVAEETFKFVRVEKETGKRHRLTLIDPIWNASDWESSWKKRLENHPRVRKEDAHPKANMWRDQLVRKVCEFNRTEPSKEALFRRLTLFSNSLLDFAVQATSKEEAVSLLTERKENELENAIATLSFCMSVLRDLGMNDPRVSDKGMAFDRGFDLKRNFEELKKEPLARATKQTLYTAHRLMTRAEDWMREVVERGIKIQSQLSQTVAEMATLNSVIERALHPEIFDETSSFETVSSKKPYPNKLKNQEFANAESHRFDSALLRK